MAYRPQLSLLDKTATFGSWLIAGALFLTVGWFALEPDDPQGAVSMLARSGSLMMLVQAIALAAVAAGLVTVIAGQKLADVGTFAVAIGLAAVSLRGGTATFLLLRGAEQSEGFEQGLAIKFVLEAVGWFVVVMVAAGASAAVMRWCFGGYEPPGSSSDELRSIASRSMLAYDLPRLGGAWFSALPEEQTPVADGLKHTLVAVVAGLVGMTVLSAGLSTRSIQHGQACFVVAAAVYFASYFSCRIVPVRSALWLIFAVGLMALVGYLWSCLLDPESPANIPSSHFMRVLPIQFISVGTAAAIAQFWSSYTPPPRRGGGPAGRTRAKADKIARRVTRRGGN